MIEAFKKEMHACFLYSIDEAFVYSSCSLPMFAIFRVNPIFVFFIASNSIFRHCMFLFISFTCFILCSWVPFRHLFGTRKKILTPHNTQNTKWREWRKNIKTVRREELVTYKLISVRNFLCFLGCTWVSPCVGVFLLASSVGME